MAKQWRYGGFADGKLASSEASNTWIEHPNYQAVINVVAGESVVRTRLQASLTFGWHVLGGGTAVLPLLWHHYMRVHMGVYANPDYPFDHSIPTPDENPSDGFWVQNELLTTHQVIKGTSPDGVEYGEVTLKCDSGTSESFGKRGPYTVSLGSVWIAWAFESPNTFWRENGVDFLGWMGGSCRISALIDNAVV